ncbi:MAG: hypothetical protein ACREMZ_12565 [Gemmatimonadales bacterium]
MAIRRGVVTPRARIYHHASSKWLPIQFHPHYKTAATMPLTQADLVVGPPVAPLSSLTVPDPTAQAPRVTPFRPLSPPAQPQSPVLEPPVVARPKPEPLKAKPAAKPQPARMVPAAEESLPKKKRPGIRKPSRRTLRLALVGALVIAGAHLLVAAGTALHSEGLRTHRRFIAAPPEAIKQAAPKTVAAVMPVLRNASIPGGGSSLSSTPSSTPVEIAPEIQPVPSGIEMSAPAPAAPDSLAEAVVDSTAKKNLKNILRAITEAPEGGKSSSRR